VITNNAKSVVDILQNLHADIAADLYPDGGWLKCIECGRRQSFTTSDAGRYLKSGWPEHCGQLMIVIGLRPLSEMQRAHDQLVGIVLGEVEIGLDEEEVRHLDTAASVLCWVLGHNHNMTFADNLAKLEKATKAAGYELKDGQHASS